MNCRKPTKVELRDGMVRGIVGCTIAGSGLAALYSVHQVKPIGSTVIRVGLQCAVGATCYFGVRAMTWKLRAQRNCPSIHEEEEHVQQQQKQRQIYPDDAWNHALAGTTTGFLIGGMQGGIPGSLRAAGGFGGMAVIAYSGFEFIRRWRRESKLRKRVAKALDDNEPLKGELLEWWELHHGGGAKVSKDKENNTWLPSWFPVKKVHENEDDRPKRVTPINAQRKE